MKVALVYPFFGPIDHELQQALEGAGLDTWIISTNLPHFQYRNTSIKFRNMDYKVINLKAHGAPINDLNLYFPFPIIPNLIQTLNKLSPDIVQTTEHVSSPSFWCNFRKKNWKTVLLERAGAWDGIVPRFKVHSFLAKKFIIPKVDAFAALSGYAADNLRILGCKQDITIVPNPVDPGFFDINVPWKERKNIILYVGRLIPVKLIDVIIGSIALAHKKIPDVELWIIGDGKYKDHYMRLASGKDYIKFLGSKSREELPFYYNQAKGFIILREGKATGIGLATEEAMACGVPIIGSDGIPFAGERHDYYFAGRVDIQRIANSIIQCILDGERYSKASRQVAENTYSHKAIGNKYKKMVETL